MNEYKIMDNYVIFKDLGSDSIGINYRAGEIEENKPSRHRLLTVVHPFLAKNPAVWKRIKILLEGIKKSNIPNLYSPDRIEVREDKTTLVYPLLKGKTFEQILEDSIKKNTPINFDLAFSIALAIADLIDTGSSIVVSGKKSFHGFLTPDNIIIDFEGKIFLKNYGIFPYLHPDDEIFSEMVKKYGAWIAPEFLRKERPIPQSDIYHLGYIIYRMLTGQYFSCLPEEDFEAKFSNITFTQHIDSSDKDFLTNIINFFKQTLNPDPAKRFSSIREFKDFISGHFKIEELSSVTFSLAYFMNSLYLEAMEAETKNLENELAYRIPIKTEEDIKKANDDLVENILIGLEEKEKAKSRFLVLTIFIAAVAVAVAIFLYLNMSKAKKARQDEVARLDNLRQELHAERELLASREKKYQEQIKAIEERITTTEEEKKARQEELDKIRKDYQEERRKEIERQKRLQAQINKEISAQKSEEKPEVTPEEKPEEKPGEIETKKVEPAKEGETGKVVEEGQKLEVEQPKVQVGQLIPIIDATVKPEKIAGENPGETFRLRKKYAGRTIPVMTSILVNENGDVEKVKILGSVPNDIKTNINKTVGNWKFKPAQKDGVKVKVWVQKRFSIKFK